MSRCDDGLISLRIVNEQKTDCGVRQNVIKIFKEIETHLKIVNFLDVTFNLANGTYRHFEKPNDSLLYISTSSKHPPQAVSNIN